MRLKAAQLIDLAPLLARYVVAETPSWRDIVDAAGSWLRPELGVSPSLWGEACRIMGREDGGAGPRPGLDQGRGAFPQHRRGLLRRHGAQGREG